MDITRYQGGLGIAAILIVVWLLSENRRAISLRTVLGGIVLFAAMGAISWGIAVYISSGGSQTSERMARSIKDVCRRGMTTSFSRWDCPLPALHNARSHSLTPPTPSPPTIPQSPRSPRPPPSPPSQGQRPARCRRR